MTVPKLRVWGTHRMSTVLTASSLQSLCPWNPSFSNRSCPTCPPVLHSWIPAQLWLSKPWFLGSLFISTNTISSPGGQSTFHPAYNLPAFSLDSSKWEWWWPGPLTRKQGRWMIVLELTHTGNQGVFLAFQRSGAQLYKLDISPVYFWSSQQIK